MTGIGLIFSILISVIFWVVLLAAFLRICHQAGLPIPFVPRVILAESHGKNPGGIMPDRPQEGFQVIAFALGTRLLMLVMGYAILLHSRGHSPSLYELFNAFNRGDGPHYINIARVGYTWVENGRNLLLVFFPLYGFLVRGLNFIVGNYLASAYIVSFTSYSIGLYYMFRLVRLDFSRKTAWCAVILISFAPPAFFFGVPMTESLMLLTSAMTLYYIRTHRWALAGVAGAFSMSTRMVGAVLVAAAAAEFIVHYKLLEKLRAARWKEALGLISRKGLWILLMLTGGGFYLFINWRVSGDPFQFLYYQRVHWFNESQYFGRTMAAQFNHIANFGSPELTRFIFIPNILAFSFAILLLLYAAVKKMPLFYIVYALGYTFISFSPSWLLSGARYTALCVPLFIFLAHGIEKRPVVRSLVLVVFIGGLVFLMGGFVLGRPVY